MEVAKPELLGVVDDDRIGVRHVDAVSTILVAINTSYLIIHEIEDDLSSFSGSICPCPMATRASGTSPYWRFHLVNVLDTVVDEEHPLVPAHLEIDRFRMISGLNAPPPSARDNGWRWRGDAGKVPPPSRRNVRYGGSGVAVIAKVSTFTFSCRSFSLTDTPELLLLVDDKQAQILETYILADDPVGADQDIHSPFFSSFLR